MRFIEIPALITEDIEDPSIVDITEPITVSISGTTMTIDGGLESFRGGNGNFDG
jgi:hypothetical protein